MNGQELIRAIEAMHRRATHGDVESVAILRDAALTAIDALEEYSIPDAFPDLPEGFRKAAQAARELAKNSPRWPTVWHAPGEVRKRHFGQLEKMDIGKNLGFRLDGKKRGFSYSEHTGFAYGLFLRLEKIRRLPARHVHAADAHPELAAPGVLTDAQLQRSGANLAALLEPLAKETLPAWTTAALELCREDCQGDWHRFPWPGCVRGKAGKVTDENGSERSVESAVRGKISQGLAMLIP